MAAGWESPLERQHSCRCSSLCAPDHQHTHPLRQQCFDAWASEFPQYVYAHERVELWVIQAWPACTHPRQSQS